MGGRALGFGLSCLTKVIIWSCDGLLGNEQIACVILSPQASGARFVNPAEGYEKRLCAIEPIHGINKNCFLYF